MMMKIRLGFIGCCILLGISGGSVHWLLGSAIGILALIILLVDGFGGFVVQIFIASFFAGAIAYARSMLFGA